ncbi:hypothetical protein HPC49_01155 [Pyxidicoccus fallax]|uniref:Uncharacterized protein n=1 Tax=Pyxidicoccus fallax TaxID=394095 RepID=A0A848LBH0_9BACT|nr:hypothetical protein [Pyxidicoccus fallax]NMO13651.1 hypothetical protein [Pyxidicoccus fallax]NPC76861.1 hypothetical protein [Pyxidicoccus fallax]
MNSIEGTEFNRSADSMPAVSMPIEVHRGGVSGGGGGVTSTGSSAIAKAWRDRLRELIRQDASAEAIERVMVDEMNAAGRNGDVGRALGIAVWEYTRIQGTSGRPMLTQAQARDIINMIADQAWKQHEQNTKRQRDDSDDDDPDNRPSKRQRTSSPDAEE